MLLVTNDIPALQTQAAGWSLKSVASMRCFASYLFSSSLYKTAAESTGTAQRDLLHMARTARAATPARTLTCLCRKNSLLRATADHEVSPSIREVSALRLQLPARC